MPKAKPSLSLTRMSDFVERPIRWLWDQRLAMGKISIIAGDPGLGKSFMTLDLAARVSRDGIMPDGFAGPEGHVLLVSAEDDPADTLLPRLRAAGANLDRLHFVCGVDANALRRGTQVRSYFTDYAPPEAPPTAIDAPTTPFVLGQLAPLRETMEQLRPKLIVIDPITAYLGECDSNNNAQVRALLAPLGKLASEFECCIVAVSHLNKSPEGSGKAMYRTMGSLAFVAAARSAWLVTRDKAAPERRIFAQIKNNLGRERMAIRFKVVDGASGQGTVEWDTTELDLSADGAMEDHVSLPGRPDDKRQQAATFLRERLWEQSANRADLVAEAALNGINERTLERAAKEMTILMTPRIDNENNTLWTLPPHFREQPR